MKNNKNGLFRPKICELGITRVCAAPVTLNLLEDGMGSVKNARGNPHHARGVAVE